MHRHLGMALSVWIASALACASTPATKHAPAASPTIATPAATPANSTASPPASPPGPPQAEIQAAIDGLRQQRGVARVTLAPDGASIVVRLCAREVESFFEPNGYPLPVTLEAEFAPFGDDSPCGCVANGQYFAQGEGMPSLDGCNRCRCHMARSMACTMLQCTVGITETVRFAPNSAKLDEASRMLLAEIVAVLKDRPNLRRVRIVGHAGTAERGPDKLSTRRAEVVRDHLVGAGVDPARLEAVGVGTTQPIGREQAPERRVEFKLEEQ
jgi:outer membrane protein OmpA-like peptidoglycan-associated protein